VCCCSLSKPEDDVDHVDGYCVHHLRDRDYEGCCLFRRQERARGVADELVAFLSARDVAFEGHLLSRWYVRLGSARSP
jgi:hypothetical protein